MTEHQREPYRFRDAREQAIYDRLGLLIGEGPQAYFLDACRTMTEDNPRPTATHGVAHLVREIESGMRAVLTVVTEATPQSEDEEDVQAASIRAVLSALDISAEEGRGRLWIKRAKEIHGKAHRRQLGLPRPMDAQFRAWWNDMLDVFDWALREFQHQYGRVFRTLDELGKIDKPTNEHTKILLGGVPQTRVAYDYFFSLPLSVAWLPLLEKTGFFSNPPPARRDVSQGTIEFPVWPQGRFLVRSAASEEHAALVADILRQIRTDNAGVLRELLDAAMKLPLAIGAKLSERVVEWIPLLRFMVYTEPVATYSVSLIRAGFTDEGFAVLETLFGVSEMLPSKADLEGQDATARRFRRIEVPWWYQRALRRTLPELATLSPSRTAGLLAELLNTTLSATLPEEDDSNLADNSTWWAPTLDQETYRSRNDLRGLLARSLFRAATSIAPEERRSFLESLDRYHFEVFRRIQLSVAAGFAGDERRFAERLLTERDAFPSSRLEVEYFALLSAAASTLSPPSVAKIANWIASHDGASFRFLPEPHFSARLARWRRDWLAPLIPYVSDALRAQFDGLVREYGPPQPVRHEEPSIQTWVGPTSPLGLDELEKMTAGSIIEYLRTWRPDGGFASPSPEGIGRTLSLVVSKRPSEFAAQSELLRELEPTYVRAVLSGFEMSVRDERPIPWDQVLELSEWVAARPYAPETDQPSGLDSDPHWGWAQKEVADLLLRGLSKRDATAIPYSLRDQVWKTLRVLSDHPDPSPGEEQKRGDDLDAPNLAINSVRGRALEGTVQYAVWVRGQQGRRDSDFSLDDVPEARDVLNAHVDERRGPSLAVRATYGRFYQTLIWLDKTWATENAERVFPQDDDRRGLWRAAWEAHLIFSEPHRHLVQTLRAQYDHALSLIDSQPAHGSPLDDPSVRLGEHLVAAYWQGEFDLHDANSMLARYFSSASESQRAAVIDFVGRSLRNSPGPVDASVVSRLQQLWDWRFADLTRDPKAVGIAEMEYFGWWFASEKCDPAWSLAALQDTLSRTGKAEPTNLVLPALGALASQFPREVIACVALFSLDDKWTPAVMIYDEEMRHVLVSVIATGDIDAIATARRVINSWMSRGYRQFRDLLEES